MFAFIVPRMELLVGGYRMYLYVGRRWFLHLVMVASPMSRYVVKASNRPGVRCMCGTCSELLRERWYRLYQS